MQKFHLVLPDMSTQEITYAELLKQASMTLLYFYPKDNTPGCTLEAQEFSSHIGAFADIGIQIVGVSKDGSASHCRFIDKHNLGISLLSDPDLVLHKQFEAWWEKNMYGKVVSGTIRSTFLLSDSGSVLQERRNFKARGHAEKVLSFCLKMKQDSI